MSFKTTSPTFLADGQPLTEVLARPISVNDVVIIHGACSKRNSSLFYLVMLSHGCVEILKLRLAHFDLVPSTLFIDFYIISLI